MRRRRANRAWNQKGQEIAEVVGGLLVAVPLLLALLDLAVIVLGNQMADRYTKAAARAAANQPTAGPAKDAATATLKGLAQNGIITSITIDKFDFTPVANFACTPNAASTGSVTVTCITTLHLPVPIPFQPAASANPTFKTAATETVVAAQNPCAPACGGGGGGCAAGS